MRDGLHMRRTLLATRTCSRLAIHRAVNTNFEQNYETVENRADNTMASNRSTRITPRCERAAVEVWLGTCGVYEKCEFRRVSLPKTVQESGPRFESEEHIKGFSTTANSPADLRTSGWRRCSVPSDSFTRYSRLSMARSSRIRVRRTD